MTHHSPTLFNSTDLIHPRPLDTLNTNILHHNQFNHAIKGLGKGDVWMYGQTHWSKDFEAGDVRVVSIFWRIHNHSSASDTDC
jgi:hypothetical protein